MMGSSVYDYHYKPTDIVIPGIIYTKEYLESKNINCGYKHYQHDCLDFKREKSINVLTIHSAKGLEFDCVIIPFCNKYNDNNNDNLPYVAYTRSRSKLIITFSFSISSEIKKANRQTYTSKING
jgi:ATP-dependent exoDNAse (exonuclease V) beta subunit